MTLALRPARASDAWTRRRSLAGTKGGARRGACLYRTTPPDWEGLTPDDVRELRRLASEQRASGDRFDIAVGGRERRDDEAAERDYIATLADAGATWWHEILPPTTQLQAVRDHIARGPLRAAMEVP